MGTAPPPPQFTRRMGRLREKLRSGGLEGVIIAPGPNLKYYTGVASQLLERLFLLFVPTEGEVHLLAPKLESGPFRESSLDIRIHGWDDQAGPASALSSVRDALGFRGRWGCEGRVPFAFFSRLTEGRKVDLISAEATLQGIREMKEPGELECLSAAAGVLAGAYRKLPQLIREGLTELQLSNSFKQQIFEEGGETVEFCMVQSGERAADPHSAPSARKIRRGESIVVDAGCTISGYNADITRSFVLGTNRRFEEVYDAVLEAQQRAIDAAAEGGAVGEVDRAARERLEKAGLGEYFIHRTGHGLGLEVHEAPYIVSAGRERIRRGMVFTVEPGAYIPGGLGVRIEDDLAVTPRGTKVITGALPREFGWWR